MPIELVRIDPFDDAAVTAWWRIYARAERADRGEDIPVWTLGESRHELQQRTSAFDRRAYLALETDEIVGAGRLALPLQDNLRTASIGAHVEPEHRRRGIGSAVLSALESEASKAGRSILTAQVSWPYEAGEDGAGAAGREFARRHGYDLALGDVQSRLDLPVDPALLDDLAASATHGASGFTLRSWRGPVPEELLQGWAELYAEIDTEAPTGTLDVEATVVSPQGIREEEDLLAAQNRISFGTIALDSRGRAVAYTQLVVSGDDGNSYQWGTLVRPEARGNGLGMAVKIANLRMLERRFPAVRHVYTYNAGVNAHMLAINTRLGFRPSERMGEFQKRLG
ncbi:GNAT family N-acetyltransferase [Microbacterium sp. NPDC055903]